MNTHVFDSNADCTKCGANRELLLHEKEKGFDIDCQPDMGFGEDFHHDPIVVDTNVTDKPKRVVTVHVDGGCRNNGSPDAEGYCSVRIQSKDVNIYRIDLPGAKTNNEAEYGALLSALDLLNTLKDYAERLDIHVYIHTDSALIMGQVFGTWKVKAKNLRNLHAAAVHGIESLKSAGIRIQEVKVSRSKLVELLGH